MDPPSLLSASRSETESASLASSTLRSIDEQLAAFFMKDRLDAFTDADFERISFLLQNSGHYSYSGVPRIYSVLRIIGRLDSLDDFIKSDATDLSFPFTSTSFPPNIGVELQYEFLQSQSLVLTKSLDLEKGERGGHVHFGKDELVPYEVRGRLGTGGYGEVEKVVSLLSHREFARKRIRRVRNQRANQQQIRDFLGELRILKRISHIHFVEMVGSYTDHKYFALLMSPVADCNLATYMTEAVTSNDKQSLLRTFFGCLANGIQFLHESKIRHRDVKPENILVKGSNVLWTDFGISLDWAELAGSTTTADSAKSPVYCPPEVANFEPRNTSADIWSLGCVFLEMTTVLKGQTVSQMRQSFKNHSENYRFYANMKPVEHWIDSLHEVGSEQDNEPLEWVKLMLNITPQHRPTAETIYSLITEEHAVSTAMITPRTFCGSCCIGLHDLSSESDEDAWVEGLDEAVALVSLGDVAEGSSLRASGDTAPKSKLPVDDSEETIGQDELLGKAGNLPLNSSGSIRQSNPDERVFTHLEDAIVATPDVNIHSPMQTLLLECERYANQAQTHFESGRLDLALSDHIKATSLIAGIPQHKEFSQLKMDRADLYRLFIMLQDELLANLRKFEEAKATIKENNTRNGVVPTIKNKQTRISTSGENMSSATNDQLPKLQVSTDQMGFTTPIKAVQSVHPGDEAPESKPRPDEYNAMMAKLLPVDPDLETAEQTHKTWHLKDWKLQRQKVHSVTFYCGGYPWRILLYPFGNKVDSVSLYLEFGHENWQAPKYWYACAQFALVLWGSREPSKFISHGAQPDWGFTKFCDPKELPLLQQPQDIASALAHLNEDVNITAYVRVVKDSTGVLWRSLENYDSKKETGMVGLKNQGATAYLNSLLQTLFFLKAFRKAVYHIPTDIDATTDTAWALQRLFYRLQTSKRPVSTQELTKSFGWGPREAFEPQDVAEMTRKLIDQLDRRMIGTRVENALSELFVGKLQTYVSCTNVDHMSIRFEDFWDIELNVRKNLCLEDSFKEFLQVEKLDGSLQWHAGGKLGLQDAIRGFVFESFPPVLQIKLKRYQYDFTLNTMSKLNDHYEFPEEFDAALYLSSTADRSELWAYVLVGVIVHDGDLHNGHNYVFIRSALHRPFYKFDDAQVTQATLKEAVNDNFGTAKKGMSAYVLIYVRKSRLNQVFADVTSGDLPGHIGTDPPIEQR